MIDKINALLSGLGIPPKPVKHKPPLPSTYAVVTESVTEDGADRISDAMVCPTVLEQHNITITIYASEGLTNDKEASLELELMKLGLDFEKQEKDWLDDEQRYTTDYKISYLTKRRLD